MKRIYEPFAYGDAPLAEGFWSTTVEDPQDWSRLDGGARCDVAIVGGGFTGLTAALHLAEAGRDVVVLDAQRPGWGASGRNGGFCCLGGTALDAATLIKRFGEADTRLFYDAEREAVQLVAGTLDRLGIEADTHSQGETMLAHRPESVPGLDATARHMSDFHGARCEVIPREALAEHGLSSDAFHGAVTTPIGFALNPMKYVFGLARAAQAAGARIFAQSPALSIETEGSGWRLTTPTGRVSAQKLIIATNGYSSDDLPAWLAGRYLPLHSNIMVTRPLSDAEIAAQGWYSNQMCYDSRNLLHYFRLLPDRRMLFGMRGAIRADAASHAAIRQRTRADFDRIFPAWSDVEAPYFWSGLVALSRALTPFVGAIPGHPGAFAGLCYHGNGVAMGSYAGALLADLVQGQAPARPYPGLMAKPPARFPFGRFRRALLRPALRLYRFQDGP